MGKEILFRFCLENVFFVPSNCRGHQDLSISDAAPVEVHRSKAFFNQHLAYSLVLASKWQPIAMAPRASDINLLFRLSVSWPFTTLYSIQVLATILFHVSVTQLADQWKSIYCTNGVRQYNEIAGEKYLNSYYAKSLHRTLDNHTCRYPADGQENGRVQYINTYWQSQPRLEEVVSQFTVTLK